MPGNNYNNSKYQCPMLFIGWAVLEGIGAALILPATTTIVGPLMKAKIELLLLGFGEE